MSFRYWYKNDNGDLVEFTDRVQVGWAENPGTAGLVMNAVEGSVGNCTLRVEDPDGDWDFPRGHRRVYVIETDAEYDDFGGVLYSGYTWIRTFKRDLMRTGAARIIDVDLVDINSVFERRIWVGADANRPAESDVERLQWAITTNEAALIDDYTFFSTDDPVAMDPVDYRGQSFRQTFDDVSLQSGKNWFLWPSLGGYSLWYGPRGTTDWSVDVRISNVLEDLDDYDETFAPAIDSTLVRDPSRVYSGIYRSYSTSYAYTQNEDTATAFAGRDTFASSPNIKTKAKAVYRNNRELSDISTEEDKITTAIVVPRAQTNCVIQGQRIQVRYSHFDGYEDFVWMRVLTRTVRELSPEYVELAMELSPDEPVNVPSRSVWGTLQMAKGFAYPEWDRVWFKAVSDAPATGCPTLPTQGMIEALYDNAGPLAPGWSYYGWKINGTGTVNVTFYTSTIGITPNDVTWMILLNGNIIASHTQINSGVGNDGTVTINDLAVVPDDVITCAFTTTPLGVPFMQAPRGTGSCAEALTITGGELS